MYAFSRINRAHRREYVVALNNAEQPASASVPTYVGKSRWKKVYGDGPSELRSDRDGTLDVTVAGLSTAVYRAVDRIPRSHRAPSVTMDVPANGRDRLEVGARLGSDQFAEVTFLAKVGNGELAGHRDRRQRAVPRVPRRRPTWRRGRGSSTARSCSTTRGHTRSSTVARSTVAPPSIALEAPNDGQRVRGTVEVRASAMPDHANYKRDVPASVNGGAFANIGTDNSSPVYTVFDDTSGLPDGAQVTYRAVLTYAPAGR